MSTSNQILESFTKRKGQIAVLIDPEKLNEEKALQELIRKAEFAAVDYFFVGGSTVTQEEFHRCVMIVKSSTKIPLVIFPGASHQVSEKADGLLYLSLISGRNPDFLIGHHVASSAEIYEMDLEVIPTGYILVDGGTSSSVAYVSQTTPIPADKSSIIINTAKAGILQGKKVLYLDAGSGANSPVPTPIISKLRELKMPVIIGGGIRSIEKIEEMTEAGANVIVIGNKIEENIDFLLDIKLHIEKNHE